MLWQGSHLQQNLCRHAVVGHCRSVQRGEFVHIWLIDRRAVL
jgi:hypothetical protein